MPSDYDRCFYVFTLSEGEQVACNNTRKDHNTFTFGNQPQHPFTGPTSDAGLRALHDGYCMEKLHDESGYGPCDMD